MTRLLVLLCATLLLVVAGCGGDDDEPAAPASGSEESAPAAGDDGGGESGGAITLTADAGGALSWEPAELSAGSGAVDIELVNDSSVPHAVAIDGVDATSDTVTGGTATLSTELEPGEYTYFCPVGNHRDAGMEGTLTVE